MHAVGIALTWGYWSRVVATGDRGTLPYAPDRLTEPFELPGAVLLAFDSLELAVGDADHALPQSLDCISRRRVDERRPLRPHGVGGSGEPDRARLRRW